MKRFMQNPNMHTIPTRATEMPAILKYDKNV